MSGMVLLPTDDRLVTLRSSFEFAEHPLGESDQERVLSVAPKGSIKPSTKSGPKEAPEDS
jgi:hypothetical protein